MSVATRPGQIGDYKLEGVVGAGSVGTVYRVIDPKSGEHRALKILNPDISSDGVVAARFRREIDVLEKLRHPNIIRIYGHGKHEGRLFYTMELVTAGSLKDLLGLHRRLDWKEAAECGWQICSALQYAHNQGIVHRDLKPANLFFGQDGKLKLGDFGIALDTAATSITAQGLMVGSYLYMSPEQITGEKAIDYRSDLYALGCVLFEMISGFAPYEGDNFAQILQQQLNKIPPPLASIVPRCPRPISDVAARLMEKDPGKRPFNARQVQGVLAECLIEWDEKQIKKKKGDTDQRKRRGDIWNIEYERPHLQQLLDRESPYHVPWWKFALMGVVLAAVIVAAAMLSN